MKNYKTQDKTQKEYYDEEMLFHNYIQDNYVFQKQYKLNEKGNKIEK